MKSLLEGLKKFRPGRESWIAVGSAISLLTVWELAADLGWVSSAFLVAPSEIARATVNDVRNGELLAHTGVTLARMFTGFFIGAAAGMILGLSAGRCKELRALLGPVVSVVYPLPKIALLPLLMLLTGLGERPIVAIIALGAFFPVLVNCIAGAMNIDQIYFDAAKNYGAGRFNTFARVILPGSLPVAFAGIRLALGMSLLLAVVVEMSIATTGLGAMLWLSWQTLRVERIYVAIAMIAVLGLLITPLLRLIERRLAPWKE